MEVGDCFDINKILTLLLYVGGFISSRNTFFLHTCYVSYKQSLFPLLPPHTHTQKDKSTHIHGKKSTTILLLIKSGASHYWHSHTHTHTQAKPISSYHPLFIHFILVKRFSLVCQFSSSGFFNFHGQQRDMDPASQI